MSTHSLVGFDTKMRATPLSPRELRIWQAFLSMGEDVLERVGGDIARATGLSGPEFGVLSRLAAFGKGEMRQQELATVVPEPRRAVRYPSATSCVYADVTVPRATSSCAARSRLDGSRVPGRSRPSRMARRSSTSTPRRR